MTVLDKKLVLMLYENHNTYAEIGRKLNVSRQRVHQIIANYKHYGRSGKLKKYKKLGKKCFICRELAMALHHKDRNNNNENIDNLIPVCKKCHYDLHRGQKHKYNGIKKPPKVRIPKFRYEWSLQFAQCRRCGTTKTKYASRGLCKNCYENIRYHNKKLN